MDTRELRYFCAAAELRSFSKASRRLRVAQPAISRQVQKLEGRLGLELFIRGGAGLELTDAGALLFERAKLILQQVEQARHDVTAQSLSPTGVVSIGVPPAAGALILPPVLRAARERFPNIKLKIIEGVGEPLWEQLIQRRLSMALIFDPPRSSELVCEPLVVERVHLFGTVGSRCSRRGPITIADLADVPLIVHSHPHIIRVLVEEAATAAGVKLRVAHEVDSLSVIRSLVHQGAGYGVLTPGAAQGQAGESKFATKPISTAGMFLTLNLVHRVEQRKSRALLEIGRLIREETRRLIAQGDWPGDPRYVAAP